MTCLVTEACMNGLSSVHCVICTPTNENVTFVAAVHNKCHVIQIRVVCGMGYI
jgi:hypothetical protein